MLTDLIDFVVNLINTLGYTGLAISIFIESFFAPIPSELILPFAGFLSRTGELNIFIVILIAGVASSLGSFPFYLLGLWGNKVVIDNFLKKYGKYLFIKEEDVDKGVAFFTRHGEATVFFGRLVPIIRTVISFPAGITGMNMAKFLAFTFLGSTLWSALLVSLGYLMGSQWEKVKVWIEMYQNWVVYAVILGLLIYIFKKFRERVKAA